MISLEHTDDAGRKFVLRGIRLRDEFAVAEIMADRADDGTGEFTVSFARAWCHHHARENRSFPGLPNNGPLPVSLTWMCDVDGETVAIIRIGYWGTHAHVFTLNVHPDERSKGIGKTIALIFMRHIGELGEQTVSFESMESSPAIAAIAEQYLELAPGEKRVGDTKQELTRYEFAVPDQQARIADPKNVDQAIPVAIVEAGEVRVEAVDVRPAKAQPVDPAPSVEP